jgi:LuxR family transcriptional regulator, maltose regulon positive regulatory protein
MERLRDALNCSLTLVSAPAGFGKTTVLSQWIAISKPSLHLAWLQLDENDNDPVRFWDYFIAAVKKIQSTAGDTALGLLHSLQAYPIGSILTALINDIADVPEDVVIVLDDYHLIESEQVNSGITFMLEHLPPKLHLVIATRVDPPLQLARFRGLSRMLEIRADDLRFTLEEAIGLLRETPGPVLSTEDIDALNTHAEGWAVGLKMAALSIRRQQNIANFISSFTGSQRYVMDYLVTEVLQQQSGRVRDFLLKTSVLERLTAPLCDYLTENNNSLDMLVELESSFGGFLIPLDESRSWYRYHHLFAELLGHRLKTVSAAGETERLHRQASRWYEANNYPDDAIHHSLAAKDWRKAVSIIGNLAEDRIKRGEMITLLGWLREIPENDLRTNLILYCQYSHILVQTGQLNAADIALSYLETADPEDNNLQGQVALEQSDIARRRGDIPRSIELARRALSLLPGDTFILRARANSGLAVNLFEFGLYDEAWKASNEAYELGRLAGDIVTAADGLAYMGAILIFRGKLREAANVCQRGIDMAGNTPAGAIVHMRLGWVLYELNELEDAARNQQLAYELGSVRGYPDHLANYSRLTARTRQAQGDSETALKLLDQADQVIARSHVRPGVRAGVIAFHWLLALRRGDLPAEVRWRDQFLQCSDLLRFDESHIPGRLMIAMGNKAAAASLLKDLFEKTVQANAPGLGIQIRVYQALAAATPVEALAFLTDALKTGEAAGYIRTFIDEGKLLAPLLRQALSRGITPDYTARLLNIIEVEERQRVMLDAIPSRQTAGILSKRELEILRLLAEGLTNSLIADRLIISLGTVKTHVHNISEKLNARTRTQVLARARELKLL